jgi:hypothetical protein
MTTKARKPVPDRGVEGGDLRQPGTRVWGRAGTDYENVCGLTTGGTRPCTLEGCPGSRIRVVWPDGTVTWPCGKGIVQDESGKLRIG